MQGRRVNSHRRKSAFPGALGRSKGRGFIGRFPHFSCGALKRRSFGDLLKASSLMRIGNTSGEDALYAALGVGRTAGSSLLPGKGATYKK